VLREGKGAPSFARGAEPRANSSEGQYAQTARFEARQVEETCNPRCTQFGWRARLGVGSRSPLPEGEGRVRASPSRGKDDQRRGLGRCPLRRSARTPSMPAAAPMMPATISERATEWTLRLGRFKLSLGYSPGDPSALRPTIDVPVCCHRGYSGRGTSM
jgi:hypothetical protein